MTSIWADHDPVTLAGFAPCLWPGGRRGGRPWPVVEDAPRQLGGQLHDHGADGGQCDGRAWPTSAVWLAPGVIAVTYGPADCGHVEPSAFILDLDGADLDPGSEGDAP